GTGCFSQPAVLPIAISLRSGGVPSSLTTPWIVPTVWGSIGRFSLALGFGALESFASCAAALADPSAAGCRLAPLWTAEAAALLDAGCAGVAVLELGSEDG